MSTKSLEENVKDNQLNQVQSQQQQKGETEKREEKEGNQESGQNYPRDGREDGEDEKQGDEGSKKEKVEVDNKGEQEDKGMLEEQLKSSQQDHKQNSNGNHQAEETGKEQIQASNNKLIQSKQTKVQQSGHQSDDELMVKFEDYHQSLQQLKQKHMNNQSNILQKQNIQMNLSRFHNKMQHLVQTPEQSSTRRNLIDSNPQNKDSNNYLQNTAQNLQDHGVSVTQQIEGQNPKQSTSLQQQQQQQQDSKNLIPAQSAATPHIQKHISNVLEKSASHLNHSGQLNNPKALHSLNMSSETQRQQIKSMTDSQMKQVVSTIREIDRTPKLLLESCQKKGELAVNTSTGALAGNIAGLNLFKQGTSQESSQQPGGMVDNAKMGSNQEGNQAESQQTYQQCILETQEQINQISKKSLDAKGILQQHQQQQQQKSKVSPRNPVSSDIPLNNPEKITQAKKEEESKQIEQAAQD